MIDDVTKPTVVIQPQPNESDIQRHLRESLTKLLQAKLDKWVEECQPKPGPIPPRIPIMRECKHNCKTEGPPGPIWCTWCGHAPECCNCDEPQTVDHGPVDAFVLARMMGVPEGVVDNTGPAKEVDDGR